MIAINLTDTQRQVLEHAADQADGRVNWFPEGVRGGARKKVLDGLFNRALITTDGIDWFVAAEGYDALGRARPTQSSIHHNADVESAVCALEAKWAQEKQAPAKRMLKVSGEGRPRTRENSKQALVIEMLKRPEGATIAQISEATGWRHHTIRGAFAGALKKKGLLIVSEKIEGHAGAPGAHRVYRIAEEATA